LATSFLLLGEDVIAYNKGTLTSSLWQLWYFSDKWKEEFIIFYQYRRRNQVEALQWSSQH
jgi:hypothetical protein